MNVLVYGWYGHGNVGDEGFMDAFIHIWKEHHFTFTDKITKEHINTKYDLCIIGGGDIINDTNLNRIKPINCPKIAISVTATKNSLSPNIFDLDYMWVRDFKSLETLKNYGYQNCGYLPDIALCLVGNKDNGNNIIDNYFKKSDSDRYSKLYTIVVNGHLLGTSQSTSKQKNTFFKMVDDMVEVIDSTSASFLFIPFSTKLPWDDRVPNSLVNSYCKFYKKNCVIYDTLSVKDTLDVISASDMIITSRFHGLIYGASHQIPTVTISFHDKTAGFAKTINQDYIDYYDFSATKFRNAIENAKMNYVIDTKKIESEYRETVYFLRQK